MSMFVCKNVCAAVYICLKEFMYAKTCEHKVCVDTQITGIKQKFPVTKHCFTLMILLPEQPKTGHFPSVLLQPGGWDATYVCI